MWIQWEASSITESGDEVVLRYKDRLFPTYEQELQSLELNGSLLHGGPEGIQEVLDVLLSASDLMQLFSNAKRRLSNHDVCQF